MNWRLLMLCVPLFLWLYACSEEQQDAAMDNKPTSRFPSLEHYLRQTDEQIALDTAIALIDNEMTGAGDEDIDVLLADIRRKADEITYALNGYKDSDFEDTLKVLRRVFYTEDHNTYLSGHSLVTDWLEYNHGNCVSSTMSFLCVADKAGIAAHGVNMPGHMMVKMPSSRGHLNIETTSNARIVQEDEIYEEYRLTPLNMEAVHYYTPLSKKEAIGYYLADVACDLLYKEDHDKKSRGGTLMQLAGELMPDQTYVSVLLTGYYLKQKQYGHSIRHALAVLEVDSFHYHARKSLTLARVDSGIWSIDHAFRPLIEMHGDDNEDVWYRLGDRLLTNKHGYADTALAVQSLFRGHEMNPADKRAMERLNEVHRSSSYFNTLYVKALTDAVVYPNNAEKQYRMAMLLLAMENSTSACEYLQKAKDLGYSCLPEPDCPFFTTK